MVTCLGVKTAKAHVTDVTDVTDALASLLKRVCAADVTHNTGVRISLDDEKAANAEVVRVL